MSKEAMRIILLPKQVRHLFGKRINFDLFKEEVRELVKNSELPLLFIETRKYVFKIVWCWERTTTICFSIF